MAGAGLYRRGHGSRGAGAGTPASHFGARLVQMWQSENADGASGLSWPSNGGTIPRTLTQAAGAQAPTVTASGGPNNRPFVSLVDTSDTAVTASWGTAAVALMIIAVVRVPALAGTAGHIFLGAHRSGFTSLIYSGKDGAGDMESYRFGGTTTGSVDAADTTWVAHVFGLSAAQLTMRVNGVDATVGSGSAIVFSGGDAITRIGGHTASNTCVGDVAAIILVQGQDSLQARDAALAPWFLAEYGVIL